jgi:tetratricopeptide (TPR) repeat protein
VKITFKNSKKYFFLLLFILLFIVLIPLLATFWLKKSRNFIYENTIYYQVNTWKENFSLMRCVSLINNELQHILKDEAIPDFQPYRGVLDSISLTIKEMIQRKVPSRTLVDTLIKIIYSDFSITFDPDYEDIETILPHMVMKNKKGSCLGVSFLFLLLAEKCMDNLYGVLLPGHFFIRFVDSTIIRNIEPNRSGYSHPDSYYYKRYFSQNRSWFGLRNLSSKEAAAVMFYNIANILHNRGKLHDAKRYYLESVSVLKDFPEAWGNLAIAYSSLKQNDSAGIAFQHASMLKPDLENLAFNMGTFYLGSGNYISAIQSFKGGLIHSPQNPDILYGIANTYYLKGQADSAQIYLDVMSTKGLFTRREKKLQQLLKKR